MKHIYHIVALVLLSMSSLAVVAQNEVNTPFAYPVAPDTCSTLESRCNYIVNAFWDNYNIARPIPDDAEFEKAFRDYVSIVKHSHRTIAITSVRNLVFKARANTNNLLKLGRVAEAALYGPYAEFWSDELYVEIARAISESTNLKQADRNYYKHQVDVINNCVVGNVMPAFDLVFENGKKQTLSQIEAKNYLLIFTDGSTNSIIDRTRLSTDVGLNGYIDAQEIKVVQVYVGKPARDWYAAQPENWVNASSEQVASNVDLRFVPSCYLINKDFKILHKNLSADNVKAITN